MNAIVDVLGLRLQHHMTVTMRVRSRVYVMRLYLAIWAGLNGPAQSTTNLPWHES
jgi:hypothetical protein